jgi:O6-methylguanine-DNA--protein-cysteine methyltransferase
MPWLYNKKTGDVEHQNEAEWLADLPLASTVGLVELPIPDNSTTAQAVAEAKKLYPTSTAPTTSNAQANTNAEATLANAIPGLSQIGDFFSALSQKNTWVRVLKIMVGGTLVIVGLAHMTGASNAVATAARNVPIPV